MSFEKLTIEERVTFAKEKTKKLSEHILGVLALHETNKIIFYSDTLSKQIPNSYAAHAFNLFQRTMYDHELVLICALWDKKGLDKESIPTVIELINHPEIIDLLCFETYSQWGVDLRDVTYGQIKSTSYRDHNFRKNLSEISYGQEQSVNNRTRLKSIIEEAKTIECSDKLRDLANFRHKHIAHRLEKTWLEKQGLIPNPKYGHEDDLIDAAVNIIEDLYLSVCHTGFDIRDELRNHYRSNAEALWHNCTFHIK